MFRASLLIFIAYVSAMPLDDARLTYKADTSCASGGQMAALQNNLPNQKIKVTLKISITVSGQTSVSDGDVSLARRGRTAPRVHAEWHRTAIRHPEIRNRSR